MHDRRATVLVTAGRLQQECRFPATLFLDQQEAVAHCLRDSDVRFRACPDRTGVTSVRVKCAPFLSRGGAVPDLQHPVQRGDGRTVTPDGARACVPPYGHRRGRACCAGERDDPGLGHTRSCFPAGARIRYAPPPTAGLPSRADHVWTCRPVSAGGGSDLVLPPCSPGSSPCCGGPTFEPYGEGDSHAVTNSLEGTSGGDTGSTRTPLGVHPPRSGGQELPQSLTAVVRWCWWCGPRPVQSFGLGASEWEP